MAKLVNLARYIQTHLEKPELEQDKSCMLVLAPFLLVLAFVLMFLKAQ